MSERLLLKKMEHRELFTDVEWNIVSWLLDHKSAAGSITVAQLAEDTYTSNATVMRTVRKLGCEGFSDFKVQFVKEAESQKYVQKHVDFNAPFEITDNASRIISSMSSLFKETVDVVNSSIDPHDITRIAENISHCSRLILYGIGDSGVTCKAFQNKLIKIGMYAVPACENGDEEAVSSSSLPTDLALFVSYSGIDDSFLPCIASLKNNGTRIIAMTSNAGSVLAEKADELLLLPDMEGDRKYATFYSQQAFSYVLNILYGVLYAKYLRTLVKKQ